MTIQQHLQSCQLRHSLVAVIPGPDPGRNDGTIKFGILNFGHWDLFVICDLYFGISKGLPNHFGNDKIPIFFLRRIRQSLFSLQVLFGLIFAKRIG